MIAALTEMGTFSGNFNVVYLPFERPLLPEVLRSNMGASTAGGAALEAEDGLCSQLSLIERMRVWM